MNLYLLGCISLGATTGYLVGASQSPVVQYALPLLFALIGGSASIFALRAPSSSASDEKLKIIGATTAALSIPFLLMSIYGSLIRTGASLSTLIPSVNHVPETTILSDSAIKVLSENDAVAALVTNIKLKNLSVGDDDRILAINHAIDSRVAHLSIFSNMTKTAIDNIRKLRSRFVEVSAKNSEIFENSGFQSHLIQLEILENALTNPSYPSVAKIRIANSVRAKLDDGRNDTIRTLLLKNKDISELYFKMLGFLSAAPSDNVLFDAIKETLDSAKGTTSSKPAPGWAARNLPWMAAR